MTLLSEATGRPVVSRASAERIGKLGSVLVDTPAGRLRAVCVVSGRQTRVVDWEAVVGFGPDAVMVESEDRLREPADDQERLAAAGKLDLAGRRVLDDMGNALGMVSDVELDPHTGQVTALLVQDGAAVPVARLRGVGSYAVVVTAEESPEPAPG